MPELMDDDVDAIDGEDDHDELSPEMAKRLGMSLVKTLLQAAQRGDGDDREVIELSAACGGVAGWQAKEMLTAIKEPSVVAELTNLLSSSGIDSMSANREIKFVEHALSRWVV